MHCILHHCHTKGQRIRPHCVQIMSWAESESVSENNNFIILLTFAVALIASVFAADHVKHSPWWGQAAESSVSSVVCQQLPLFHQPHLWALTTQIGVATFERFTFFFLRKNLVDSLPADQIFNILSHDPLQNCVEITEINWIWCYPNLSTASPDQ